jgi:hypothetical protein
MRDDGSGESGLQIAERSYLAFASTFAGRLVEGLESCETACRTLPADQALGVEFTGYSPCLGILMTQAWLLVRPGRLDESTVVWGPSRESGGACRARPGVARA